MRKRAMLWWAWVLSLLLPAGFLTLNRLVEPSVGRLVRAESFTPYAIPLYLLALVAAAVVLARQRTMMRPAVAAVALVAVAGLALHATWFSNRVVGANPPPAADAQSLIVLTANLYAGRADPIEVVRTAAEEEVDVLVVEEVTMMALQQMEQAGVGDLFPSRIGSATALDADGTMVFSRTPLGDPVPIPTGHQSWQVSVDGLTLFAVHPYSPTVPERWRTDHAAIAAAAAAARPDLIVGDFNATLDHPPMRALASGGWRSVAELANEGWQPTWPDNRVVRVLGLPLPLLVQIDHVLVGPRLAAITSHTVDVPGSDHRAVVAEVARK